MVLFYFLFGCAIAYIAYKGYEIVFDEDANINARDMSKESERTEQDELTKEQIKEGIRNKK